MNMAPGDPGQGLPGIIASLYAMTVMVAIAAGTMFLLVPINALDLGGIFGGFTVPGMLAVGVVLANVPAGMAVSHFGPRPVMIFGLALAGLGTLAVAVTSSLLLMGLACFGFGVGASAWSIGRLTWGSDHIPLHRRGRVVAGIGGMYRVGMFLGPAIGGYGAVTLGREITLQILAAGVMLAATGILLLIPRSRPPSEGTSFNPLRVVSRVVSEHHRTFTTAGLAMWALALVRNGRLLLIPVAGALLGLEASETGLIKSIGAGADMLFFYPAGLVMDRFGRKWTAVPCLLTISAGVLLIGYAASYEDLLIAALVAGIGNGMGSGINMTLAGDFSPGEARAEFIGVWHLLSDTGGALSPFLMGAVAQSVTLGAAGAVSGGIGMLGAALMLILVREPLRRRLPARSGPSV